MAGDLAAKMAFFIVFYGFYFNILLLLLVPAVYQSLVHLAYLLLFYGAALIDNIVRPVPEKKELDPYTRTLLVFFGIQPFLFALAFYENLFLISVFVPAYDNWLVAFAGLVLYVVAAGISVGSRVQLGTQGSGRIEIRQDHNLVTTGMYGLVRHPMYLGGLLGTVAFGLVFRSIVVMLLALVIFLAVFRERWLREEEMMEAQFGDEYKEYKKRTKRLIPAIY